MYIYYHDIKCFMVEFGVKLANYTDVYSVAVIFVSFSEVKFNKFAYFHTLCRLLRRNM